MIIYKITNIITHKCYIGKTTKTLQDRKKTHLKNVRLGHTSKLYNAIRKYGLDSFIWEQVDACEDFNKLNELESHYIKKFDTFKNGYNMTLGGDGGDTISMKSDIAKKNQGVKVGNVPWNKGVSMKNLGYNFYERRKPPNKKTEEQKKNISIKIKNSEKYRDSLNSRTPAKQVIIEDDLGNIWYKLKDFKTFIGLSRYKIMIPLLKGDWNYNGRTYKIIYQK